jgi:hypothetical protein
MFVVCVVRYRSVCRADHSSRGVLQTVARRCVLSRNLMKLGGHSPRWAAESQEAIHSPRWAAHPEKIIVCCTYNVE